MSTSQTFLYGLLLVAIFLAYQEYPDLFVLYWIKAKTHLLNAYMFVKARQMHWQLSKEAGKLGMAFPPFHFTPIWERD